MSLSRLAEAKGAKSNYFGEDLQKKTTKKYCNYDEK